jgi:hypothetical protein
MSVALIASAVIAAITLEVIIGLLTNEARGWLPHLSAFLISRAAHLLPRADRARWEEEMLADLATLNDRPLTGLVHAITALASMGSLARELDVVTNRRAARLLADAERFERAAARLQAQVGPDSWQVRHLRRSAAELRELASLPSGGKVGSG